MDQSMRIMNDMKRLGFSEYECKAYLTLLQTYPLNGYALSKHSGIPRSRIYEVIKSMINKQMVTEQAQEKQKLYYPMEPELFIRKLRKEYEDAFTGISQYVSKLYQAKPQDDKLVVIKGRQNIIDFLKILIKGAEQRVAMSIWDEEIQEIIPELDQSIGRGVMLRGIYFGESVPYDTLVPHRRIKRYMAEKKQRYLSIIIDGSHAVSGVVSRGEESKVTWTRDEGFIEISEDYIAHDLLVNLYSASLGNDAYKAYEAFADKVHNQYFHYSEEEFNTYRSLE
ncbi:MAG: TrmB family transcriptional regulator [Desulfobacteraceae bacterium]|nr:MAG: TrmB family transcriptional regulator [Desulfobacteraceae bacterium]